LKALFKESWTDLGLPTSHGYTYPSVNSTKKLDYIFVTSGIKFNSSEVLETKYHLMHLPLVAEIEIKEYSAEEH
jgi:endonuclease/exonuclease/phosphatase family metal-dependent hydrolase